MTHQSKSYKKFVATAATATLVASALVPTASAATSSFTDVSKDYKEAVDYIVERGFAQGTTETTFGTAQNISRGDAAVMIANALDLDTANAKDAGFQDVNNRVAGAVNAIVEAEIASGRTSSKFDPAAYITRQEMAKMLANAYELEAETNAGFTDVNKNWIGFVSALKDAGITLGKTETTFAPEQNLTRGEFALFMFRAETVEVAPGEPTALAVNAINSTSLTVTGTDLDSLEAEEVTVEKNTVNAVTASEDGKSATIHLAAELTVDEVTKVTIAGKSFDVTYKVEATTASIVAATYDDDTKDQFVALKIDGKNITSQELLNAGYNVEFKAYPTKAGGTPLTSLFESESTGELKTDLATSTFASDVDSALTEIPVSGLDVYVQVTLTKGSDVIVSDLGKIKIQNIDLAANAITSATLYNFGVDKLDDGTTHNDDFVQNSTTLITNEKAKFSEITVKAGSEEEEVTANYTVKSSDSSVVSVDTNGVLTAQGPGTATVTITYGGATTTKTITVKNGNREAAKVTATSVSLKAVKGGTASTNVYLVDQYGDPLAATLTLENSKDDVATVTGTGGVADKVTTSVDPDNPASITFTGVEAGSSIVTFRDEAGVKVGTTTVKVDVTANDDLTKYGIKVDDAISDADVTAIETAAGATGLTKADIATTSTLDLQAEKFVKLDLTGLNSEGTKVSDPGTLAAEYEVTVSPSRAGVIEDAHSADGFIVVEAGSLTGTATITVTNVANNKVTQQFKVSVTDVGYNVKGATLKTVAAPTFGKTITYKDVVTYKAAENDPIISGLTLTRATAQPVRLNLADDTLYIDKDANGVFDNDDVIVGGLTVTTTGNIADVAPFNVVDGVVVASGDEGEVLFKVEDKANNVVATRSIKIDF